MGTLGFDPAGYWVPCTHTDGRLTVYETATGQEAGPDHWGPDKDDPYAIYGEPHTGWGSLFAFVAFEPWTKSINPITNKYTWAEPPLKEVSGTVLTGIGTEVWSH